MRNPNHRIPDFNSFKSHSGDEFHVKYSSKFNPDGTVGLSESGRVNIQAEINSHAAETDMAVIISKLSMGDTSVLTSKTPMFGDFTQFPKTYPEMLNLFNSAESIFDHLPLDIKSKYDNDFQKWFSSIGSESWLADMGVISEPVVSVPDVVPDVIKEGSVLE